MENPNLNQIVNEKVEKVKTELYNFRKALSDRWIATDSHLYNKVCDALDSIAGMFAIEYEDFVKTEAQHKAAQEAYLAGVVEVKKVKHPVTGEMVDLRVRKPQVRMVSNLSNGALLAEQVATEMQAGTIHTSKGFIHSPFISDGLGFAKD